jgi:hypothetical protein
MEVVVQKKLQVFMSSTYTDMLAERQAAAWQHGLGPSYCAPPGTDLPSVDCPANSNLHEPLLGCFAIWERLFCVNHFVVFSCGMPRHVAAGCGRPRQVAAGQEHPFNED